MAERERQPDGYIDPNIPAPDGDGDAPVIIYGYTPHLALSALALALYALLALLYIAHLLPLQRHRKLPPSSTADIELNGTASPPDNSPTHETKTTSAEEAERAGDITQATAKRQRTSCLPFTILLLTATVFEIVGYAFRLRSSPPPIGNPYAVINFVIQYFFIVVAPVFISAAIYTTLTYLIRYVGEEHTPLGTKGVSRRKIIVVFVICDVVATLVQVAGAALIGAAESNGKDPGTANNILLAGLAFQVFSFLVFLGLLAGFLKNAKHVLFASTPSSQDARRSNGLGKVLGGIRVFVLALVAASLLVYLRTIFRLAETCQGVGGYASSREAFFGALEFAPVVLAVGALGVWHPGLFVGV